MPVTVGRRLRVLISAGEASGEMYGAALMDSLREHASERGYSGVECFGLGGELMRASGCNTVVDARDVAVVGLFEVLSHLPKIYGEFHRLLAEVDRSKPDVAVLVDFPDWNFRLAKQLHRRGIPVVYYVSPQLWAWRKGRIKLVQKYVSKMLVIFPFEQEFYREHGVTAEFVGHPLGELEQLELPMEAQSERQRIALLPGSRRKEILLNLPLMLQSAALLPGRNEFLLPAASTVSRDWLEKLVAENTGGGKVQLSIQITNDARATLAGCRAAIVASGTATVEAAVIGTPFVMVYRLSPVTYTLGRRLVKVPFYGMVNLIAGRQVVPELIQDNFNAKNVVNELQALLEDGPRRRQMIADLADVRAKLRAGYEGRAADNAARAVMEVASRAT
jgi:lipid-A-disaccharide synthase